MKTLTLLSLSALSLGLAAGCQTASSTSLADDARVTVQFEDPENFTDLKDGLVGTPNGREDYQEMLTRYAQQLAAPHLRDGQSLTLTFTDVDLAGDYLPTASSGRDIRVIKAVYPPRMELRFVLRDANGAVVKEGERTLTDLAFQNNLAPLNRNDELFYDRELLRDWLARELR